MYRAHEGNTDEENTLLGRKRRNFKPAENQNMDGGGLGKKEERMSTSSLLILGKLLRVMMPHPVTAKGRQKRDQERKQGREEHL